MFGITLGFGLSALVNLLFLTAISFAGYQHKMVKVFDIVVPMTTLIVQTIWLLYIGRPEPAREAVNVPVTSPLLRWNEVALALGHSGGRVAFMEEPESFMPNVERMVEEVMKRDMFADRR